MLTLKELAALAGVSTSTVSKAMNNSQDISAETRDYIVDLAVKHGYQKKFRKKNSSAQGISGPKIGMICTDLSSRHYARMLEVFSQRVREMGGILLVCDARFSEDHAISLCNYLDQQCHVDGIIAVYGSFDGTRFPKTRAPLVGSFSHRPVSNVVDSVQPYDLICVNNKSGMAQALEYLMQRGHRDFAYIGERYTIARNRHWPELMQQYGLPMPENRYCITDLRFEDAGYEMMHKMLQEGPPPTAVICGYDDIAVGASKAILEFGLRIPEDISLVGFNNCQLRLYDQKILASIDGFIEEQVRLSLDLLMNRIANPGESAIQNVVLQTAFVPTETVGPAPGFCHGNP